MADTRIHVRKARSRSKPASSDPAVAQVFASYASDVRARLLALRRLILETAAATDGVGEIEEALRWGQPSYLTSQSRSGSTIRIDQIKGEPGRYAMYFNCQTNLVSTFRELYPDDLAYGGNRSILFSTASPVSEKAVRHCIALALTHHLRRNQR